MNPLIIFPLFLFGVIFLNIRRDYLDHRDWKRSGIKSYSKWTEKTGRGLHKKVWKVY